MPLFTVLTVKIPGNPKTSFSLYLRKVLRHAEIGRADFNSKNNAHPTSQASSHRGVA